TEAGDDREALRKLALAYHDRADGARARALYDRFLDTFHPEPAEARWIGALIADTLRLDGEFAAAWTRLDALRLEATAAADTAVLRRLEDLAWLLGRDGSECQGVAALARFVREYPESPRRPGAERLLEQRRQQLDMLCA